MEFAEKVIPGPRFRVTGLKTAGESGPLLKVFAVGATRICSTSALTSRRSAFSQGVDLP
ncbi:hypothetical protein D9M72_574710 [compost metagenome]